MAGPNPFSKTLPLTALGAVGGPTGTAAGTLRVIVDFIANYDGERVKELESELTRLAKLEETNKTRLNKLLKEQQTLEDNIEQERETRQKIDANRQRKAIGILKEAQFYHEKIRDAQKAGASPGTIRAYEGHLTRRVNSLMKITGLSEAELRNAVTVRSQKEAQEVVEERIAHLKERQNQLEAGTIARQKELGVLQQFRQQAVPRLLGLGVGALGGIFGGALFSVGWEAAQAGIDKFSSTLQDMVDPARHARENVEALASAIEAAASDENLSNLQKATEYLNTLGPGGAALRTGNPDIDRILALAVDTQKLTEAQTALNQALEQGEHGVANYEDALQKIGETVIKQSQAYRDLKAELDRTIGTATFGPAADALRQFEVNAFQITPDQLRALVDAGRISQEYADAMIIARDAVEANLRAWGGIPPEANKAAEEAAAYADALERATNEALEAKLDERLEHIENEFQQRASSITTTAALAMASVDRIAQGQIDSVIAASDAKIGGLRDRLTGLSRGPSARTRRLQNAASGGGDTESARTRSLQAQIEAFNRAQERRAYLAQLSEIAEDRYYLKFQRRLELQNRAIRIDDYSGRRRVTAIEVVTAKIQKQADVQDRLNRLLDLQYEASKRIERQQGETIKEFLDRRSQEYRHQIEERVALDREERLARLEELKTEAEYRVALAENTQKRLEVIRAQERKRHLDSLQAQLKASQEADRAAAAAQRDRLNKQLAASREADRLAYERKRKAIQDEIDQEEKRRDDTIKVINAIADAKKLAIELERDRQLKINEKLKDSQIETERKKYEAVTRFASKSENERLQIAMRGAKTMAQLNAVAGHLAGSNAAFGQLQSYVKGLGLNDVQTAILLANIARMRVQYAQELQRINLHPPVGGMAQGGVFTLDNMMNFGRNMRVGEEGDELGVVLSHRVADILQRSKSGPMIGTINIEAKEDPVQTAYRLRRMVKQAQEAQL